MLGKMTYYDTVFRTCDTTYLSQPGILVGSAVEQSAIRKSTKYALQPATHVVISVAFKTLGPVRLSLHSFTRSWDVAFHLDLQVSQEIYM